MVTANCRGVLAAPILRELDFTGVSREYLSQMLFPTEIVTAHKEIDEHPDSTTEDIRRRSASATPRQPKPERWRAGCCGPAESSCGRGTNTLRTRGEEVFWRPALLRRGARLAPRAAKLASLGRGIPTPSPSSTRATASIWAPAAGSTSCCQPAGSAPTGKAYGLDMTNEMLELAGRNQLAAGVENVHFIKGAIERIPLPDTPSTW